MLHKFSTSGVPSQYPDYCVGSCIQIRRYQLLESVNTTSQVWAIHISLSTMCSNQSRPQFLGKSQSPSEFGSTWTSQELQRRLEPIDPHRTRLESAWGWFGIPFPPCLAPCLLSAAGQVAHGTSKSIYIPRCIQALELPLAVRPRLWPQFIAVYTEWSAQPPRNLASWVIYPPILSEFIPFPLGPFFFLLNMRYPTTTVFFSPCNYLIDKDCCCCYCCRILNWNLGSWFIHNKGPVLCLLYQETRKTQDRRIITGMDM